MVLPEAGGIGKISFKGTNLQLLGKCLVDLMEYVVNIDNNIVL